MNIPDAPPALRQLLRRLLAEASTEITQHKYTPAADEWFAGRVIGSFGGGDFGPYSSAEDAIVGLVRRVWQLYDETREERDAAEAEARELRDELTCVKRSKTMVQIPSLESVLAADDGLVREVLAARQLGQLRYEQVTYTTPAGSDGVLFDAFMLPGAELISAEIDAAPAPGRLVELRIGDRSLLDGGLAPADLLAVAQLVRDDSFYAALERWADEDASK